MQFHMELIYNPIPRTERLWKTTNGDIEEKGQNLVVGMFWKTKWSQHGSPTNGQKALDPKWWMWTVFLGRFHNYVRGICWALFPFSSNAPTTMLAATAKSCMGERMVITFLLIIYEMTGPDVMELIQQLREWAPKNPPMPVARAWSSLSVSISQPQHR